MPKHYLNKNVYEAAIERLQLIFNEFETIYFSFSGGKDSGVMIELALEVARKMGRLPLNALVIDLEGHYKEHVNYALRVCDRPEIKPYWLCLPISLRNAVSQFEPKWVCWDPKEKDKWIREMPDRDDVVTQDNMPDEWNDWFRFGMEFEELVIRFGEWISEGKTACVVAIRADESMNRFRTIVSDKKTRYKGHGWSTKIQGVDADLYNFYPIYDWRVEDIWTYIGKTGCDYNRIYDAMYKAGRSLHDMRICQPYGDDQRKGLDLYHLCEPESWFQVVQRVAGANFGAIYRGGAILGNIKVELPPGHTWQSYANVLLKSMPPYLRDHYVRRINVFLKWWARELGHDVPHLHKPSPGEKFNDVGLFVFDIPDDPDPELGKKYPRNRGPSWKRICKAIIKNDYYCKSLSFNQNQQEYDKLQALKQKYAEL